MNESKFTLFVGIDIAKDDMEICYSSDLQSTRERGKIINDAKGIAGLLQSLLKLEADPAKIMLCFEPCGAYSNLIEFKASEGRFAIWRVNPKLLKNWSTELNRCKDDVADARKIFEYAVTNAHRFEAYDPGSSALSKLKQLFALRKQLIKSRGAALCRLSAAEKMAYPAEFVLANHKKDIKELDKRIVSCEQQARQVIDADPKLKEMYMLMISVPGIGPVIASRLLLLTLGFTRITSWRQMAAYIGSAPFSHQSGTSLKRRRRVSKVSERKTKGDLYMGLLTLISPGRLYGGYYAKQTNQGKHHLYVMNNVINKHLNLVYKVVEKKQVFNMETYLGSKKMI